MIYIAATIALVAISMIMGYRIGLRRRSSFRLHPLASLIVAVAGAGAWWALATFARRYAETDAWGWSLAERWAHSGKWYGFAIAVLVVLGFAFAQEHRTPTLRRAASGSAAVLLVVWLMAWRTLPIYAFLPRTNTRHEAGSIRQSVEYTCGPVSLANLLERFHGRSGVTEREIARLSGTTYEGTTTSGLIRAARWSGLRVVACRRMTLEELEQAGRPALIMISTIPSVRHAMLYLRSDADAVHFLDPGGTGFSSMRRDRFINIWYGKTLILE